MAFDLAGRVVLQDAFSGTLDLLMGKSKEAEGALADLGAATDAPVKSAKLNIQELEAEVDRLTAKARAGDITPLDVEKFKVTQGALRSARADLDDVAQAANPVNDIMNAMTLATVATAAAFGALGVAMQAVDFAKVGAQALDIERTYANLAQSANVAGDELVAAMSKAARGTIDDSDLMLRANRALLSGNKEIVEAYPKLLEGARASALAQGKDVNEVFTAMNEAILRANPRLLAQAGIYLRLGNVMKDYADAHGKAVASLTMEDRQAAMLQATLSGVADLERRTGADAESASDQINSLSVAFGQLREAAGKALVRAGVAEAIGGIAKGIQDQLSVGDMAARYKEQVDKIRSYDKERADQLNAELQSAFLETQKLAAAPTGAKTDEAMIAFYQRRTAAITDEARALEEALNPEVALTRIAAANAAARAAAQQKELEAAQAYNDVLDAMRDKLSGQAAVSSVLGTIAGQIEAIASGLPQLSQMPANILAVSPEVIQSYRDYTDAAERTGQISAANAVDVRKHLDALQEQQAAIVIGAQSFRDHAAALDYVAQNTIGVTASGKDLLATLQQQPAWIQVLVASLLDYDSALKIAQADSARGLTLETRQAMTAMMDVANQADRLHSSIANIRAGASDELNKLFAQGFPDVSDKILQIYDFNTALQHIQDTAAKPLTLDLSVLTANLGRLQADSAAGLQTLATAAHEAGLIGEASVLALVEGYSKLPPEVQKSIDKLGGLDAALAAINAEAVKPVTIDVRVQGLEKALGDVDAMALKLATTLTPDQVRRFNEQVRGEVEQHWLKMGLMSKFEQDQELARVINHYQKLVANQTAADQAAETAAKKHADAMKWTASDLQSSIEKALSAGATMTSTQALEAKAGMYQDVALENARRLDAIMERGFQELKAHPDWAGILKIPESVLASGDDALKAWASRTAEDVRNFFRPDLIDKDAFLRQWDEMQMQAGERQLTLSMLAQLLIDTGRGEKKTPEELQADAAKLLGIANPEIVFDTKFQADSRSYGETVTEFLGHAPPAEIPAKFVVESMTPAQQLAALGIPSDGLTVKPKLEMPTEPPAEIPAQFTIEPMTPAQMLAIAGLSSAKIPARLAIESMTPAQQLAALGIPGDGLTVKPKLETPAGPPAEIPARYIVAPLPPMSLVEIPAKYITAPLPAMPPTEIPAEFVMAPLPPMPPAEIPAEFVMAPIPPVPQIDIPARIVVAPLPAMPQTDIPARFVVAPLPPMPPAEIPARIVVAPLPPMPQTEIPAEFVMAPLPLMPPAEVPARVVVAPLPPMPPAEIPAEFVMAPLPPMPPAEVPAEFVMAPLPPMPQTEIPAEFVMAPLPPMPQTDIPAIFVVAPLPPMPPAEIPARVAVAPLPPMPQIDIPARFVVAPLPPMSPTEIPAEFVMAPIPPMPQIDIPARIVVAPLPAMPPAEMPAELVVAPIPPVPQIDIPARVMMAPLPAMSPAEIPAELVMAPIPPMPQIDIPARVVVAPLPPMPPTDIPGRFVVAPLPPMPQTEIPAKFAVQPMSPDEMLAAAGLPSGGLTVAVALNGRAPSGSEQLARAGLPSTPSSTAGTNAFAAVVNMPTADNIGQAVARAIKEAGALGSVIVNMAAGAVTLGGQGEQLDPAFIDRVKSAIADAFGTLISAEQKRPQFARAGLPGNAGGYGY